MTPAFRLLIGLAGLMGAAGVALAAASAHGADASRLASASAMLLFHATAILAASPCSRAAFCTAELASIAAFGFVIGAALFAGDLTLRAICGALAVSVCRADRWDGDDPELAGGDARGGVQALIRSPDGAKRNPGPESVAPTPDYASLHPGYIPVTLCAAPANRIERAPTVPPARSAS